MSCIPSTASLIIESQEDRQSSEELHIMSPAATVSFLTCWRYTGRVFSVVDSRATVPRSRHFEESFCWTFKCLPRRYLVLSRNVPVCYCEHYQHLNDDFGK